MQGDGVGCEEEEKSSVLKSGLVQFFPILGPNRNHNRLPYFLNYLKVWPNRT